MERGGREGGHWVVVGLRWGEWVGGGVGGTIVYMCHEPTFANGDEHLICT